jgi:hypothetical protein
MSDQQPPDERDTAAVAGPNEAPGTAQEQAEVDWQKRYNDLQPEYTRTTQQLREFEQQKQWYDLLVTSEDPDTRRQAAEALGYELPEAEAEDELEPVGYDDPIEQITARQQALEEQLNQSRQEQQMAQEAALIREFTDERLNSLEGLNKKAQDWVLAYAINSLPPVREPGVPVPLPDVNTAYEAWQELQTEEQKGWARTKRAPAVMPGGITANEVPDPGTGHNARMNRAMRVMSEADE